MPLSVCVALTVACARGAHETVYASGAHWNVLHPNHQLRQVQMTLLLRRNERKLCHVSIIICCCVRGGPLCGPSLQAGPCVGTPIELHCTFITPELIILKIQDSCTGARRVFQKGPSFFFLPPPPQPPLQPPPPPPPPPQGGGTSLRHFFWKRLVVLCLPKGLETELHSLSRFPILSLYLNCPLSMSRSSRLFGVGKRSFTQCLWKGHVHRSNIMFQCDSHYRCCACTATVLKCYSLVVQLGGGTVTS